jgi:signal transduction histidine kinase
MIGVLLLPPTFTQFSASLVRVRLSSLFHIINYSISLIFISAVYTPLFARGGEHFLIFSFWPNPGPFFHAALIYFGINVIFAHVLLVIKYFNIENTIIKNQILYMLLAGIFGFIGGSVNYLPWYRVPLLPVPTIFFSLWVLILAYAILKYRLMDIRVALTRAGIFIFVYSFIFALPIWFGLRTQLWLWSVALMGILSPIGIFVYSNLREQTEAILFKEEKRYQRAIRELAKRMMQIRDMGKLLRAIVAEVNKVVNPEFVLLYTFSKTDDSYVLEHNDIIDTYSFHKKFSADSPFVSSLSQNKKTRLVEGAASLNLPLETLVLSFYVEGGLFGFLLVGPKPKKTLYTESDLIAFDILSSQVSLTLENAKNFQELKRSQMELLRQENLKFVSVLVKGLAHEILNPLTPLMHRIEDLEGENLLKLYGVYEKNKDKFDQQDNAGFKEAFLELRQSTKSLKNNAEHIHLIINTLQRMQKGDETTIGPMDIKSFFKDIAATLTLEVEPALQEGVTVNQDIEKNIPSLKGNPTLLKQIFINLYKNACEAMKNSAAKIITICCKINALNSSEALIEFSDSGPGIPSDILPKIFSRGFTTKGAKGSGVGLSQCKTIIEKFGGAVTIESEQDKGTKFIIKLPIWKEG